MLQALIGPVASLLDKFIPDADTKNKLAHEIATLADKQAHEVALAQIEVNKEVNFLVSPLAEPFGIVVPQADISTMMPVLLGMLGLAGARSFERVKKVGK